jgi:hypothetical protein
MLSELHHTEPFGAFGGKSDDETTRLQLHDQGLNVGVVERKDLRLDPAGPVLDDSVPVSLTPKAGEQEPPQRVALA